MRVPTTITSPELSLDCRRHHTTATTTTPHHTTLPLPLLCRVFNTAALVVDRESANVHAEIHIKLLALIRIVYSIIIVSSYRSSSSRVSSATRIRTAPASSTSLHSEASHTCYHYCVYSCDLSNNQPPNVNHPTNIFGVHCFCRVCTCLCVCVRARSARLFVSVCEHCRVAAAAVVNVALPSICLCHPSEPSV